MKLNIADWYPSLLEIWWKSKSELERRPDYVPAFADLPIEFEQLDQILQSQIDEFMKECLRDYLDESKSNKDFCRKISLYFTNGIVQVR